MDAVIISNFQNAISASASTTKSYNPTQENKCFTRLINEDKCEHTEIFPKKGCEGWVYFLEEGGGCQRPLHMEECSFEI